VLITVSQAAKVLGLKSRESIYRKIRTGDLASVPGGEGSPLIERDGLEDRWQQITREQKNSPKPLRSAAERTKAPTKAPTKELPPPRDTTDLPDYNESRARSEFEKANLLELQRKTQEGLLLRREDAEQAWNQAVNITRTRLLGVPSTAKQRIPHLEIEEVELLTGLIREALDELAAGEVKA
jgi:predicted DNA-binding transcriptional regulator AlpA